MDEEYWWTKVVLYHFPKNLDNCLKRLPISEKDRQEYVRQIMTHVEQKRLDLRAKGLSESDAKFWHRLWEEIGGLEEITACYWEYFCPFRQFLTMAEYRLMRLLDAPIYRPTFGELCAACAARFFLSPVLSLLTLQRHLSLT